MKQSKSILKKCVFLIAMLCIVIHAQATEYSGTTYSGNCTWVLDTETGILTIIGSGEIGIPPTYSSIPWYSYRT